jgi:hypothetical protein
MANQAKLCSFRTAPKYMHSIVLDAIQGCVYQVLHRRTGLYQPPRSVNRMGQICIVTPWR